jgi:hypothetical protein
MAWSYAARQAAIEARRRKMGHIKEAWVDRTKKYSYGDCAIKTAEIVKRLVSKGVRDGYRVVSGSVLLTGGTNERPYLEDHVWMEFGGKVIDPTKAQFGKARVNYRPTGKDEFGNKPYRKEYTPDEFLLQAKKEEIL